MKNIFFIVLILLPLLIYSQEKYPYQYGVGNGSIAVNIVGFMSLDDAKIIELIEYRPSCYDQYGYHNYKCGEPVLLTPFDKIERDNVRFIIKDIPSGMYSLNVRYAPQGNDIWCTACSKAVPVEVVNDSKYICINEK